MIRSLATAALALAGLGSAANIARQAVAAPVTVTVTQIATSFIEVDVTSTIVSTTFEDKTVISTAIATSSNAETATETIFVTSTALVARALYVPALAHGRLAPRQVVGTGTSLPGRATLPASTVTQTVIGDAVATTTSTRFSYDLRTVT